MRGTAAAERGAACQVQCVFDVRCAHYPGVVPADVNKKLIELDILLRKGVNQVVILQSSQSQDWGPVELCVVQTVEQMNAARAGGGEANSEPAGELRVAAGHECSCFLVPHLNEPDFLLALPQRLHDPVDPIARDAENSVHSPVDQA